MISLVMGNEEEDWTLISWETQNENLHRVSCYVDATD